MFVAMLLVCGQSGCTGGGFSQPGYYQPSAPQIPYYVTWSPPAWSPPAWSPPRIYVYSLPGPAWSPPAWSPGPMLRNGSYGGYGATNVSVGLFNRPFYGSTRSPQ